MLTAFQNIKLFIFIVLCFVSSSSDVIAQSKIKGDRNVKIEQTNIEDFHTISVGNDLEVVLIKSTSPSVIIEADSNLHPVINFRVQDSILNFQVNKIVRRSKEFKAIIRYTESLRSIILNGNVDVESENSIQLDRLSMVLHDNSKIKAEITTNQFSLENNNDGGLKLSTNCVLDIESKIANLLLTNGSNNSIEINSEELNINTKDKAELDIEGFSYKLVSKSMNSSELNAKELLTNISEVMLAEKTDVSVQASDSVKIDISGAGKLTLYGQAKVIIDNFSGTSSIQKKEL